MTKPEPKTVPCDKCNVPIVLGHDIIYTIANKYDDDDLLISSRHGKCQPSREELRKNTEDAIARCKVAIGKLRDLGIK